MLKIHKYRELLYQQMNKVSKLDPKLQKIIKQIDLFIDNYDNQDHEIPVSKFETLIQSLVPYPVKNDEKHIFLFLMNLLKDAKQEPKLQKPIV